MTVAAFIPVLAILAMAGAICLIPLLSDTPPGRPPRPRKLR